MPKLVRLIEPRIEDIPAEWRRMFESVKGQKPTDFEAYVNPLDLKRLPLSPRQIVLAGWRYLRELPEETHTLTGLVRNIRADDEEYFIEEDDIVCRAEIFSWTPVEWLRNGQAERVDEVVRLLNNVKDARGGWPDMFPFLEGHRAALETAVKEMEDLD